ncbi:MAG: methyltransferase domain-containing protein [Alphaproteobacteria bacterium]|jgi:SAM-dependent methyltransferase|nr:methyltransferase domain-containing protein [Alphaproteobacteria bacterium]
MARTTLAARAPDALLRRGLAALQAGRPQQAVAALRAAVAAAPKDVPARLALASALARCGETAEAIVHGLRALALDPGREEAGALLAGLLGKRRLTGYRMTPAEARAVTAWLERPDADRQAFAALAIDHLKMAPPVAGVLAPALDGDPEAAAAALLARAGRAALTDPLLLALLRGALVTDPAMEAWLTAVRRQLPAGGAELACRAGLTAFAAALAQNCALNEYVFAETVAETAQVAALEADLAGRTGFSRAAEWPLLLYALYRPLDGLPGAAALAAAKGRFGPAMQALLTATLEARLADARYAAAVPELLPDSGGVSAAVRAQYEANPYPRWTTLRRPRPGSWRAGLAGFASPAELAALGPAPAVLIAGCGTGRQAILAALAYGPEADVLAVDLSRASLGYAARMAEHYGIENVRFARADLLRLPELGRRFAVIECSGVLHHLDDMAAGLRALAACLQPGGLMRLALYSRTARRHVNAARAEIARRGLPADPAGIRTFRQALFASPEPWARAVRETFRDVYSLSGCRDLLFHVQEHQLTIPALATLLADSALTFRGFILPPDSRTLVADRFATPEPWHDLNAWKATETTHPDLFLGMYDFWVGTAISSGDS